MRVSDPSPFFRNVDARQTARLWRNRIAERGPPMGGTGAFVTASGKEAAA
jgi:hypothetical protein